MSDSSLNPAQPSQASVRSLPPRRMQNIRQMFENNASNESTSSLNQSNNDATESYVKAAQSKFESEDGNRTSSPVRRWRQHIPEPKHVEEQNLSPRRRPRTAVSPVRLNNNDVPVPSPRKSVLFGDKNEASKGLEKGLTGLPVKDFGKLAGAVVDTTEDQSTEMPRVSRLVSQMETGSQNTESHDRPQPAKRSNISPNRTSPNRRNISPNRRNISPNRPNDNSNRSTDYLQGKHSEQKGQTTDTNYLKLWEAGDKSNKQNEQSDSGGSRPVSVMARLKMFEGSDSPTQSTSPNTSTPPTLTKPAKPPPPYRQRSFTDNTVKKEQETKSPPKRPPFRQSSLVDKTKNGHEKEKESRVTFVDPVENESVDAKPTPPRKPPRTHAHDDYVKVKLEQGKSDNVPKSKDTADETNSRKDNNSENTFPRSSVRKNKPNRPPPPRKPRPFSIAVDSMDFSNSDSSDSEWNKSTHGLSTFYEVLPFSSSQDSNDPIKHWDLPRANHPEPIRRSLSSDCVPKAVDDEGNVVYMEPDKLGLSKSGGFDIYVDDSGYAVPHRLVKKSKSSTTTESENSRAIGDRVKSKFKKFKNLFSDDKTVTVERGGSGRSSHRWKLDAIKQKVDQAFEVLKGSQRTRSFDNTDTDTQSSDSATDTDSKVDEKEIRKRVEYSRSVRIKTSKSIKESGRLKDTRYPQLFEHAMIIGLELKEESSIYSPYMKYKFPEIRNYKLTMEGKLFPLSDGKDTNVSVPLFCFPDAANFKPSSSSSKSQSYNFVLTNIDGGRVYGYCRRFVPPKSPNKVPEVICIISPVSAFKMYNTLLEEIETKRRVSIDAAQELIAAALGRGINEKLLKSNMDLDQTLLEEIETKRRVSIDAAQELIAAAFGRPLPTPGQSETIRTLTKRRVSIDAAQELIAAAFGRPLPTPGQSETIRTLDEDGEMETLYLQREADNRIENVNCECVLSNLGVDKMLKVFATILNERSVLFCAKTLSTLSSTINGITSLLYPFSWQHTFIPVLPAEMIDVICSPTPYIIGITSSLMAKALTLPLDENVLVVDLDKKSFVRSQGDEGTLLPTRVTRALKTSLNMCRVDSEAKSVPDLMISEAFLRFFIEVIGHYGQFIHTEKDGRKSFQKDEFIEGASSSSLQQLLQWFAETQMFEVFTTEQIEKKDWGNTIEFFQSRVQEVKCNPGKQLKRRLGKKLS